MTEPEIYAGLKQIFQDVFDDDSIALQPGTTAADIEGWDSQAHVSIIVAAEMHFGIRFRTSDFARLNNVGEFVSVIAAKLQK